MAFVLASPRFRSATATCFGADAPPPLEVATNDFPLRRRALRGYLLGSAACDALVLPSPYRRVYDARTRLQRDLVPLSRSDVHRRCHYKFNQENQLRRTNGIIKHTKCKT